MLHRTEKRASLARSKVRTMPKKTLPPIGVSGALYVLAIAAGDLLSKPVAAILAVAATIVLLLAVAGYERVQRHLPDLGRLPFVVDHGLHTGASKQEITTPVHTPASSPAVVAWSAPSLFPPGHALMTATQQTKPLSQTERLTTLYYEGEQLRARILLSASALPSDFLQGTANQRQVARERLAQGWDKRVLNALADDSRPKWIAAGVLPKHKLVS
jgi:hypothetical protein